MAGETSPAGAGTRNTWLAGIILTFLSKAVMPVLWLAVLTGVPVWV